MVIKNNPLRKIIDNSTWVPLTMKIRVEDSAGNASQEFSQQYQDENVKPLIEVFSNRTTFNKPTATQTDFTDTAELTIMLTEPDHDATSGPGLELSDLLVVRQSRNNRDYITNFHEVTEGGFTPHTVYKATYVFTSTSTEAPMIQIAAGAFTDRAGNVNVGGIFSVLDNVTPTINVRSDMPANSSRPAVLRVTGSAAPTGSGGSGA